MSSAGLEACLLAERAGLDLDPWQRFALDVMLAEGADGKWAAFEVGLLVARQNGKGGILEARALAGLFLFGDELIVWSAHEFKTAKEAYYRVKRLVENTPDLHRRVKRRGSRVVGFRQSNEDTSIELESGQRLKFLARSKGSGRGFTGDTQILDEAQELAAAEVDAMMPTLLARANGQLIYAGTVPSPENDGAHFESVRDRGRALAEGDELAWLEWSPDPGPEDDYAELDLDDQAAWRAANPAMGYRVTAKGLARSRRAMSDEGFAREHLSVWVPGKARSWQLFTQERWRAARSPLVPGWMADPVTIAVETTPDRAWTSIGAAGAHPSGATAVEVIEHRAGTDWVVARLVELAGHRPKALLIDKRSPAGAFLQGLAEAGIDVTDVTAADYARACGSFFDAVMAPEPRVVHHGQPELDDAAEHASKRPLGDSWVFDRRRTVSTPLGVAALARYGHHEIAEAAPEPDFLVV